MILMRALPSLLLVQGMAAFLVPSCPISCLAKVSPVSRQSPLGLLRAEMVEEKEAISALKGWDGFPGSSRIVCAPQQSDAAVMSTFFKEVVSCPSDGKADTLLVSPNCKSSGNSEAMKRMAEYFKECCPWSDTTLLEGAPHASFTFTSKKIEKTAEGKSETLSEQEVMGKVLDWFTSFLIGMDDEEEYVEVGRALLSVKRYAVSQARTPEALKETFWAEVSTLAEAGDGNTLIVAPDLEMEAAPFDDLVQQRMAAPLNEWAASALDLRVSNYHPSAGTAPAPWPIIQIYAYDPPPAKQEGDELDEVGFDAEIDWGSRPAGNLKSGGGKGKDADRKGGKGFGGGGKGFLKLDELEEK
mmetsp:Transcript_39628/g.79825  ORF Transcript_39628/g.79825 Transcript_39628/m.79825 type:complete len:356 (-) Transcript_39628:147-1214(-)